MRPSFLLFVVLGSTLAGCAAPVETPAAKSLQAPGTALAGEAADRLWSAPEIVVQQGAYFEPMVFVDSKGVIYYLPNTFGQGPWRSKDGGTTWVDIAPDFPGEALPATVTDTALNIAPDDSVWFSRSGFSWQFGGTQGCTSTDQGDTWTCDSLALPGPNDRMWIVGLDSRRGYLYTTFLHAYNNGYGGVGPNTDDMPDNGGSGGNVYTHAWAYTDSGSARYTPYATTTDRVIRHAGSMAYDPDSGRIWQAMNYSSDHTVQVARVDDRSQTFVDWIDTKLPMTMAPPIMASHNGTFWVNSEPVLEDQSRGIILGRSKDPSHGFEALAIPTTARSVTLSHITAGPDDRVAAIFYGSDTPGNPRSNQGIWSVYVVESENANDPEPTWAEHVIARNVRQGPTCIGITCGGGGRWSGDMIGIDIDGGGNVHVAYMDQMDEDKPNGDGTYASFSPIPNLYARSFWPDAR